MKTFIVIANVYGEPTNNDPKEIILLKVVDTDDKEKTERQLFNELHEIYVEKGEAEAVEVDCYPIEDFKEFFNVIHENWD